MLHSVSGRFSVFAFSADAPSYHLGSVRVHPKTQSSSPTRLGKHGVVCVCVCVLQCLGVTAGIDQCHPFRLNRVYLHAFPVAPF